MKHYLAHCSVEDIKRIEKKIKDNMKDVRNDRQKKFFLSAEYITDKDVFEYIKQENNYVLNRVQEERVRAWTFLNDKENDYKYGWIDREDPKKYPKQTKEQLEEWGKLAYPNINVQMFETEFELMVLEEVKNA